MISEKEIHNFLIKSVKTELGTNIKRIRFSKSIMDDAINQMIYCYVLVHSKNDNYDIYLYCLDLAGNTYSWEYTQRARTWKEGTTTTDKLLLIQVDQYSCWVASEFVYFQETPIPEPLTLEELGYGLY
jgi:hypothetical protein